MQFYLDQMEQDNIIFLKGKDEKKAQIRKFIEASMSYISPNKQVSRIL